MGAALLEVENLTSGYGALEVLRGVSLCIEPGQLVAIVGPNGHGKSTFLKTVSGLVRARAGRIGFAGADIARLRPDRIVACGVLLAPQGDMLFPDMTVRENLMMGAYLPQAAAEATERLDEVYALLPKLRERQGQIASTLSGGERRMAGIGRALMGGGRLLMLDEPSLGLAPIVIDQIYELIDQLKASGRTILLVEENVARIFDRADHVYLMDDGRFVFDGGAEELMRRAELIETYLGG
jgi:branched-chain amino acid transport system ATP-binding protein